MRQISLRWWIVLLVLFAVTNAVSYTYGKVTKKAHPDEETEVVMLDDEDVVIIIARPEKNSQSDALDESFFRAHIIPKETSWLCVGKGNLLKYRGHIFSRKPLQEGEQMLIPFLQ